MASSPAKTNNWTFFTNHSHVLICLFVQPSLRLREVAAEVGITERAVQKIVNELEESGYLRITKTGRRNQYEFKLKKPLRHSLEKHCTVQDFVNIIADQS